MWWEPPGYVEDVNLESDKCAYCHVNTATRLCNNCEALYCSMCYIDVHNTKEKRAHIFKELKADELVSTKKLMCVLCKTHRATRVCNVCNEVYCENCHNAKHLKGSTVTHPYKLFNPDCIICSQCLKVPADKTCKSCNDSFCDKCFEELHKKGARANHDFNEIPGGNTYKDKLEPDQQYCIECGYRAGSKYCKQCGDVFCIKCWKSIHAKGNRLGHKYMPWQESGTAHGWQELTDDETGKKFYFNTKTRETQVEKPAELMFGEELDKYLEEKERQERNDEKEKKIKELEDKVKNLQNEIAKKEKLLTV